MFNLSRLSLMILLSFAIVACANQRANKKTVAGLDVTGVEVSDLSVMMGESHYKIYYLNDLTLYEWNYTAASLVVQMAEDPDQQTSTGSRSVRTAYFVFQRDSSFGFDFDPNPGSMYNGRMRVDSFMKRIKGTNRFDSFALMKPDTVTWSEDHDELREAYVLKMPAGMPSGYLVMYYSKALNHLKESFNQRVDSIKQMKFYKYETIFYAFYDEQRKQSWPSLKDATEMRPITGPLPDTVLHYLNLYKSSIQKPRS
jgi:hypothetical protein